jgi:Holliday junction resolvasome RuvABC DNA-binding subunit
MQKRSTNKPCKKIKTLKIIYDKKIQLDSSVSTKETQEIKDSNQPNEDLLNKAIPCLVDLGFTKQEAIDALTSAYIKQPTQDISIWIKNTLLEIRNNG